MVHKRHLRAKQVHFGAGGGTRKVCLKKDSTEQDILQEAKKLFFPNVESPKDKVSDFDIDLWDFLERIVENSMTSTNVREHNNADDDPVMRHRI